MFIEGLNRLEESGKDLTWANYIEAMDSAPVDVPMGGAIDYANGSRLGIADLALNKFDMTKMGLITYSGITSLDDVMEAVK